jgi:hypothetical protein
LALLAVAWSVLNLRAEDEPQIGYPKRRLRNPSDDLLQLFSGPPARLQYPAVELDPV